MIPAARTMFQQRSYVGFSQSTAAHTTRFLKKGVLCAMLLLGSLAHLVFLYPHPLKSIVCLEGTLLKSQDYGCSFQEELSHSLAQAGHIML